MDHACLPVGHTHLLVDLWFDKNEVLKYVRPLRAALIEAARAGGAQICHSHFHQFSPWGVTGFLLLQESHVSLHTWVEERYAALDVYGCGAMDHLAILRCLVERLEPEQVAIVSARRGRSRARIAVADIPW
jgi:S-adenosylmethionine decarboxylase proenzyme